MSNYSKDDAQMARLLNVLDEHVAKMNTHGNTMQGITDGVAADYVADSSTIFQQKMNDWHDGHAKVTNALKDLHQNLTTANRHINAGEDSAAQQAGAWSGSGESQAMYSGLTQS